MKSAIHKFHNQKNHAYNGLIFFIMENLLQWELAMQLTSNSMVVKSGSEGKQLLGWDHEKTPGSDELLVRAYMLAGEWEKPGASL